MLKKYVTAPIFYANAEPHVGHAYTAILCDTAHRWNLLRNPGESSLFSIGTDEHGSKIYRAAQNAKKDPQDFCDEVSSKFSKLFKKLGISNTHFIRTTNSEHKKAVQNFWKQLNNKGLIYKSKYSGYYSIVDECFFPENEVEQKGTNKVVKKTSTIVEWVEEENYMFKLSEFRDPVRKWIEKTNPIFPKKYESLAIDSLDMAEDLSISRSKSRLSWGIPVPNDESQTIYVWLDALVNYLTVAGYPNNGWEKNWSPSCQVIGKDIVKFHCFYWPAFLLAADIELPRRFFVHGHWLVDNVKMSKSLGNVIDPNWACEKYTPEGLRYFLLKNGNPNDDSSFNTTSCLEAINSDMVNNIGNLLNRSTVKKMNPSGMYPGITVDEMDLDVKKSYEGLIGILDDIQGKVFELYDDMLYYKAIELLMGCMKEANRVFQLNQPWKEKDEHKLASILLPTYESIRIVSILLQPIIPQFSEFSLNRLGVPKNERSLECAKLGKGSNSGSKLGLNNGIFIERLQK